MTTSQGERGGEHGDDNDEHKTQNSSKYETWNLNRDTKQNNLCVGHFGIFFHTHSLDFWHTSLYRIHRVHPSLAWVCSKTSYTRVHLWPAETQNPKPVTRLINS